MCVCLGLGWINVHICRSGGIWEKSQVSELQPHYEATIHAKITQLVPQPIPKYPSQTSNKPRISRGRESDEMNIIVDFVPHTNVGGLY